MAPVYAKNISSYSSLSGALDPPPLFASKSRKIIADGSWDSTSSWCKATGTQWANICFDSSKDRGIPFSELRKLPAAIDLRGAEDRVLEGTGAQVIKVHINVSRSPVFREMRG